MSGKINGYQLQEPNGNWAIMRAAVLDGANAALVATGMSGAHVTKDDAPAAALALLQASGWEVDPEKVADFNPPPASSDVYIQVGIAYLSFAIEAKACEDAEAMYDADYEAEVLEIAKAIFKAMHPSASWEEANDFIKGDCIKQARAAYAHMKGQAND